MSNTQYYIANLYLEEVAVLSAHLCKSLDEETQLLNGMTLKMKMKLNKY